MAIGEIAGGLLGAVGGGDKGGGKGKGKGGGGGGPMELISQVINTLKGAVGG